ncbi:Protein of unknown function [Lactobacillus helveticus CIRM-BIA 103]|nr:Protein of unknown function [Lactobacillus helveticus CIRM-BIA 103]
MKFLKTFNNSVA